MCAQFLVQSLFLFLCLLFYYLLLYYQKQFQKNSLCSLWNQLSEWDGVGDYLVLPVCRITSKQRLYWRYLRRNLSCLLYHWHRNDTREDILEKEEIFIWYFVSSRFRDTAAVIRQLWPYQWPSKRSAYKHKLLIYFSLISTSVMLSDTAGASAVMVGLEPDEDLLHIARNRDSQQ